MSDRVGQQFGNYRLVCLLGQGGFAEVYLGQHVRLNLQAAIKVLHTHLADQEVEHFQQEAETIATLMHPSIVRILDYDVQEGVPFLVMDYAPGGSLRRRYPKGSVVPLPVIVSSVKQVAAALQYAHERKFIHRDVKPENMLVGRQEDVLLSDFGLAALAHSSGSLSTKEAIGTLAYMAPEQIEGHPRPASDQYALAVVVYEWLCGSRPFEGSPTEVMVQQLSMPPASLHEKVATIPPGIEQVVLRALAKDPKARFASVRDFATALGDVSQLAFASGVRPAPASPDAFVTVAVPAGELAQTVETPSEGVVPAETPPDGIVPAIPLAATTPVPFSIAPPLEPTIPVRVRRRGMAWRTAALLTGLAVLVVAGGVLGSLGLLAHFGVIGAHSGSTGPIVARGGTWTVEFPLEPDSLIPNGSGSATAAEVDQALYLPLFYSDAQGVIHAGAASEVPTVQNKEISTDATTWTFHLRPHLKWSDGQPYDARDVDYTWKLWLNPAFTANNTQGINLITSAVVSADHLSITFHLKQPYVPFLQYWVDGLQAPLPAHYFSSMASGQILKSPDNLNPQVVSGPFKMSESKPGNHYTLVRNSDYYQASAGLPYLDRLVFSIRSADEILKDLQTGSGSLDSTSFLDFVLANQRFRDYTLVTPSSTARFDALFFNFHNVVLASHLEVRQAIAMAINYQAVIASLSQILPSPLCIDHGSFYHPGFEPAAPCPIFDATAANQLLDDNGWVKGPDGVRSKGGQRLEFEYAAAPQGTPWRFTMETFLKNDLQAIGIRLDIQHYPGDLFFGFLAQGKASPPTGAVAGRYDIAEFQSTLGYDPDDSSLLSCDQFPPQGINLDFYCNHALDALYQQELATPDPGLRQQIFAQIHQIYLTDFPFIVLFGAPIIYKVRKRTHNYQPSPLGLEDENVWEWWCDNGKC